MTSTGEGVQEMDLITSLDRLNRAGSEYSRSTAKLVEAAGVVGQYLADGRLPLPDYRNERGVASPRGYVTIPTVGAGRPYTLGKWDYLDERYVRVDRDRAAALDFAADLAAGLLDELAEWAAALAATSEAAAEALGRAIAPVTPEAGHNPGRREERGRGRND